MVKRKKVRSAKYEVRNAPRTTHSALQTELAAPFLSGVRNAWQEAVAPGMTPARLARILQAAAEGDMNDYLILAEEMEERDLHYRCELAKRRLAVCRLPAVVEAASDDEADVRLADEVRELIRRPGFTGLMQDLLDALGKGFAVCEIMWERGEFWTPREYRRRDPRFFVFDRETGSELRLLDERAPGDGLPLEPLKFIAHTPRLKSGLPVRGGIARVASWAWMCKTFALKDWMAFAEVYGMPLRLGKYQPGADSRDIQVLKTAVANLGSDAAAVIPESMMIEFVEASGNSGGGQDMFLRLADWLDTQISRGILGQSATTQGTPGRLGNDQAQAEVRHDIRDDDALQLAETLNRDLVRPFIDINHGPQTAYPRLVIRAEEGENLALLADSLTKLIPLGLTVEQSVIRDRFGLPEPAEDAAVLGGGQGAGNRGQGAGDDDSALNAAAPAMNAEARPDLPDRVLAWGQAAAMAPVDDIIRDAERLLADCADLAEFRDRLIDLYADTDPAGLAEALAQMDLLAGLAGQDEVKDEAKRAGYADADD